MTDLIERLKRLRASPQTQPSGFFIRDLFAIRGKDLTEAIERIEELEKRGPARQVLRAERDQALRERDEARQDRADIMDAGVKVSARIESLEGALRGIRQSWGMRAVHAIADAALPPSGEVCSCEEGFPSSEVGIHKCPVHGPRADGLSEGEGQSDPGPSAERPRTAHPLAESECPICEGTGGNHARDCAYRPRESVCPICGAAGQIGDFFRLGHGPYDPPCLDPFHSKGSDG